jgi:hypothetical protein
LAALDPVAFLCADLNNISHCLARDLSGLRGAHRPYRFEPIGNRSALRRYDCNAAYSFRRDGRDGIAAGAAKHPAAGASDQQSAHCEDSILSVHGVTTGD